MGGLIARHAAGHLFDERTGLIAGLQPAHFITMATPHLGCETGSSPAQVSHVHCPVRYDGSHVLQQVGISQNWSQAYSLCTSWQGRL